MDLHTLIQQEHLRRREFPVVERGIFLGHAGVCPLPRVAAEAMREFAGRAAAIGQEDDEIWTRIENARAVAARLIGANPGEIALLGPTALGLNLVANGISWGAGDEIIYNPDDYPANVYPWIKLRDHGVRPIPLEPHVPGVITWDRIEEQITGRTRLVALATCNYLSGYRIDVDRIGKELHQRNILFCLDAIQSLGAFPLSVEHVDFLSADSHKWMLGPVGAGIFYVKEKHFDLVQPTLLGAWNVYSPEFVAQDSIRYYDGARRYEPGSLNIPGILSMAASLELLQGIGIEQVGRRILAVRDHLVRGLMDKGCALYPADEITSASSPSGIVTFTAPREDVTITYERLVSQGIRGSLRRNREGQAFIRLSPHFYNTVAELDRVLEVI